MEQPQVKKHVSQEKGKTMSCFPLFHDWTKWKTEVRQGLINRAGLGDIFFRGIDRWEPYTKRVQVRQCRRCGWVQEEPL